MQCTGLSVRKMSYCPQSYVLFVKCKQRALSLDIWPVSTLIFIALNWG